MTAGKGKEIAALVAGCRRGNKYDWEELIARITPIIFSICRRFRLSREESFDVFGKVSLLLLEHLAGLREESKVFGYVATIAYREAAAVRDRGRLQLDEIDEKTLDRLSPASGRPDGPNLETWDDLEILAGAFAELPWKCRELLQRLFFDQSTASYKNIAEELDIPVQSIGPTRARCLEKLRKIMIEKGFEK